MQFDSPRFAGDALLEDILNDPDTGTKKLQKHSPADAVRKVQQALFDMNWPLRMLPPITDESVFVDGRFASRSRACNCRAVRASASAATSSTRNSA